MKPIVWLGALLAFLGILGLAIPVFTTSQNKEVVKLGVLKSSAPSKLRTWFPRL